MGLGYRSVLRGVVDCEFYLLKPVSLWSSEIISHVVDFCVCFLGAILDGFSHFNKCLLPFSFVL